MTKKYIQIEQNQKKLRYEIYKNYCIFKNIKPISYRSYIPDNTYKILEKNFPNICSLKLVEEMFSILGLKEGPVYHDTNYKWYTAYEIVDKNLFNNFPCFKSINLLSENQVSIMVEYFNREVDIFCGDY